VGRREPTGVTNLKRDDEMNHILFEIDERFGELKELTNWSFELKDFNDDWEVFKQKERFRWTINDLLSYIRSLRDKLSEGEGE
jgi:hypothetical protein